MIRSPKGVMVVEDFQQVLLDSSLNTNSFASISPALYAQPGSGARQQFTTIVPDIVVSGKNNPNKTHLVCI